MMEATNYPVTEASTVRSKKGIFARRLSLDSIVKPGSNSIPSAPSPSSSPSPKGLGSSLHKRFSSWGWRSNSIVGNILNLGVVHEQDKKPKGSKALSTSKKRRGSASSGTATIVINYTDGNTEVFHGADGAQLKELLSQAAMDYRISSYRVIMDSARAILNSDSSATSIGESIDSGEEETNSLPEGLIAVPVPEDAKFKIVYQLLKSERLYVNRLQSVLDSYAEPLRKFSSLSVDDHRVLFVGLEPIVSLSAMLNSKLEDALKSWDPGSTKIGNQFSSTFWNHYEDYFHDYPSVKILLKEKFETEDGFVEFCELRQGKSKYSLDQLLCLPVCTY